MDGQACSSVAARCCRVDLDSLSWLLAAASVVPVLAGTMFIVVFGVFAVGETMYAPVLNPLTASLAPSGMVGTTLGIFAAL